MIKVKNLKGTRTALCKKRKKRREREGKTGRERKKEMSFKNSSFGQESIKMRFSIFPTFISEKDCTSVVCSNDD